jgi:hypothetical protein
MRENLDSANNGPVEKQSIFSQVAIKYYGSESDKRSFSYLAGPVYNAPVCKRVVFAYPHFRTGKGMNYNIILNVATALDNY